MGFSTFGPPYIQSTWSPFNYGGQTYGLTHLDEYIFSMKDSTGTERKILVSFSDHCFTRKLEPSDDPALVYPGSDRRPGCFCIERHALSLDISNHLFVGTSNLVYLSEEENLAIVTIVSTSGVKTYYGIFFNLDKLPKRIPAHLHMRIRTAFPFTTNQPTTHGDVSFARLITMRMNNKFPKRTMGKSRKWPPLEP